MYYDNYQSVAYSTAILEGLKSYFVFAFIISIVYAVICAIIASKKDRNPLGWAALGFLFGLIAIIIIAVIDSPYSSSPRSNSVSVDNTWYSDREYPAYKCSACGKAVTKRTCPHCGKVNEWVGKINYRRTTPASWICSCGARNSSSAKECTVCYSKKPQK